MATGTDLLYYALYLSPGRYHRIKSFAPAVRGRLDNIPATKEAFEDTAEALLREAESARQVGPAEALRILLATDLKDAASTIASVSDDEIVRNLDVETSVLATMRQACEDLRTIGVDVPVPDVFIVDEIPPPYNRADYAAINFDEEDHAKHGMPVGIYLVRRHLRPLYSRTLILHELVHVACARANAYMLARGLEEGLAEIIGSVYLFGKQAGFGIASNVFASTRLWYGFEQFWELYLEYTRLAALLYRHVGLRGFAELLNKGRSLIKEVEVKLLQGETETGLPSGGFDPALLASLEKVIYTPRALTVSALAAYLASFTKKERNKKDIFAEARVDPEEGLKALRELENRVFVASLGGADDPVSNSDTPLLGRLLRYEVPSDFIF